MRRSRYSLPLLAALLLITVSLPACNDASADGKSPPLMATRVSNDEPSQDSSGPFTLPQGDAERLLEFIDGLREFRPQTQEEADLYNEKAPAAIKAAAEQVMAMVADKSSKAYQQASAYAFSIRIGNLEDAKPIERKNTATDVIESVRDAAKQSAELAYQHLDRVLYLVDELRSVGDLELAALSLNDTATIFRGTGDAQLAEQANQLQLQAELILIPTLPQNQQVAVYETTRDRIANTPGEDVGETEFNVIRVLIQELESSGNFKLTARAYREFSKILRDTGNDQLEADVALFETLGQPLVLSGETHDGQSFDWEPYRGKVVLVNFWATWCIPCVQKIPHLTELQEQYKDRGFEIVGISLDHEKEALDNFMTTKGLPWTVLHHPGGQHPAALQYNVQSLPYTILVNEEGYLVGRNLTMDELDEKLEQMFGQPDMAPNKTAPE